jgi:hypothetical protein
MTKDNPVDSLGRAKRSKSDVESLQWRHVDDGIPRLSYSSHTSCLENVNGWGHQFIRKATEAVTLKGGSGSC